jgi:diacylglycerol kinase family enzyme
MLGCGFDAEVIHHLHRDRRGNITHFSYAKPILEAIRRYRYPPIRISCHETPCSPPTRTITAHWAFVFNTPSYASGLAICPDADPFDGHLDVVTFRGGSLMQGLIHLGNVILRRQQRCNTVETVRTKVVRIESAETVRYQVDGDPGGSLPVELNVVPNRVCVVVPPSWCPRELALP